MRAWPAPELPAISRPLPALRLHDSATDGLVETPAGRQGSMYVCGITPYDATHLGHAATYLAFDLVNRYWRAAGHDVHYVQNVTDVDDPLLERAAATGVDWVALAEEQTELFRTDMQALRVLPPQDYVGAVEAIDEIADLVLALRERGATYEVDDDVYFSVASAAHFGEVSGYDPSTMLALSAERGGDPTRAGKKDPLDPLLWLAARPGDPSWPSPLGPGRPGWHVECTAIALNRLGPTIDVQGGGSDLAFPHHEMGAAHASVATGVWPFARAHVHAGMVALDGEKMSKSRGNLVFVSELRAAGHDAAAIRLALLAHHYRSDWQWSAGDLTAAEQRLARWQAAARREAGPDPQPLVDALSRALADDLDAPQALRAVDRWAETAGEHDLAPALDAVDALLGVRLAGDRGRTAG